MPNREDLYLRRKWTLRAHDKRVIFYKKRNESSRHVFMKAFIWALYLPQYADLRVEVSIQDHYKPDVVALDWRERPIFWGEAGEVGQRKIRTLLRRYRHTHFVMAKWDTRLAPYIDIVQRAAKKRARHAPFDLIRFPADSAERFISADGVITLQHSDLEWVQLLGD